MLMRRVCGGDVTSDSETIATLDQRFAATAAVAAASTKSAVATSRNLRLLIRWGPQRRLPARGVGRRASKASQRRAAFLLIVSTCVLVSTAVTSGVNGGFSERGSDVTSGLGAHRHAGVPLVRREDLRVAEEPPNRQEKQMVTELLGAAAHSRTIRAGGPLPRQRAFVRSVDAAGGAALLGLGYSSPAGIAGWIQEAGTCGKREADPSTIINATDLEVRRPSVQDCAKTCLEELQMCGSFSVVYPGTHSPVDCTYYLVGHTGNDQAAYLCYINMKKMRAAGLMPPSVGGRGHRVHLGGKSKRGSKSGSGSSSDDYSEFPANFDSEFDSEFDGASNDGSRGPPGLPGPAGERGKDSLPAELLPHDTLKAVVAAFLANCFLSCCLCCKATRDIDAAKNKQAQHDIGGNQVAGNAASPELGTPIRGGHSVKNSPYRGSQVPVPGTPGTPGGQMVPQSPYGGPQAPVPGTPGGHMVPQSPRGSPQAPVPGSPGHAAVRHSPRHSAQTPEHRGSSRHHTPHHGSSHHHSHHHGSSHHHSPSHPGSKKASPIAHGVVPGGRVSSASGSVPATSSAFAGLNFATPPASPRVVSSPRGGAM
eukprot:TRINITY_DN4250_c0_g1_i1.p1 TRINITY_DN4250_c0_g1~~TRINITY_DN4250_c0_g1_i1.p1  ORF type:complete len:593 (+),score=63.28 TRINITY_DN4250_c0_g1_i1:62-1840(+)